MSPHPALPQRGREILLEERIWLALAEINDPEMPVNLVDLGQCQQDALLKGPRSSVKKRGV